MKEIKKYLEDRQGEYGFYFQELDCGYVYGYNENVVFEAGECIHIPLALVILREIENGNINFNDKILLNLEDCLKKRSILSHLKPQECTIKELLIFMLMQNDCIAYEMLLKTLGVHRFNKYMLDIGMINTKISNQGLKAETSAYDLSKCWNIIIKKEYISKDNRKFILDTLKHQICKDKIAFYYSQKHVEGIASKCGSKDKIENDSCYLKHDKGNFIFTILSKNIPSDVYGKITLAKSGKMAIDIIENSWK